jgi:Uncharacterized protein conserved in bacteria (DUF2062)
MASILPNCIWSLRLDRSTSVPLSLTSCICALLANTIFTDDKRPRSDIGEPVAEAARASVCASKAMAPQSTQRTARVGDRVFHGIHNPFGAIRPGRLDCHGHEGQRPPGRSRHADKQPLTFPPIYFAAYKVGFLLLPNSSAEGVGDVAQGLGSTLLDVSGPTALGLLIFAIFSAVLGHVAGAIWWRISVLRRWRRRHSEILRR